MSLVDLQISGSNKYESIYPNLSHSTHSEPKNEENLNVILNKIKESGICKLDKAELTTLESYVKNKKTSIQQIKQLESLHQEKTDKKEKIKKSIAIGATIIILATVIFALAYFAAPAIALALTTWLATAPAGAAPAVVASAKAALAAGTYRKLGAAHGMLSMAYMGLSLVGLLFFAKKHEQEKKHNLEHSKIVEEIFSRFQQTI